MSTKPTVTAKPAPLSVKKRKRARNQGDANETTALQKPLVEENPLVARHVAKPKPRFPSIFDSDSEVVFAGDTSIVTRVSSQLTITIFCIMLLTNGSFSLTQCILSYPAAYISAGIGCFDELVKTAEAEESRKGM